MKKVAIYSVANAIFVCEGINGGILISVRQDDLSTQLRNFKKLDLKT